MVTWHPERTERVHISFQIDKGMGQDGNQFLKILDPFSVAMEGSQIHLDFDIEYFDLVDKLNAVIELVNGHMVHITSMSMEEINHGKILAKEFFEVLQKMEDHYALSTNNKEVT